MMKNATTRKNVSLVLFSAHVEGNSKSVVTHSESFCDTGPHTLPRQGYVLLVA